NPAPRGSEGQLSRSCLTTSTSSARRSGCRRASAAASVDFPTPGGPLSRASTGGEGEGLGELTTPSSPAEPRPCGARPSVSCARAAHVPVVLLGQPGGKVTA